MPRLPNTSPPTRAVLATLLATRPQPTYGYDLSRATGLKSGTLYPILQRLHEQGFLKAEWESAPPGGRPPRHLYTLTDEGVRLAQERLNSSPLTRLKGALP